MALSRARIGGDLLLRLLATQRSLRVTAQLKTPVILSFHETQKCFLSSKTKPGIARTIVTKLKSANQRYERFLEGNFPRFYILYTTFFRGFQLLFRDAREFQRIQVKLAKQGVRRDQLPYREMELLRQFRRDIIKVAPLVLISIPPFANYFVFVLMYFFPRQVLIRHFWTPKQQTEFANIYHGRRAQVYPLIMNKLVSSVPAITNSRLQTQMLHLCNKVQGGMHPSVEEIQGVRQLFTGPPFGMKRLQAEHMRNLSPVLMLTSMLPAMLLQRRLARHSIELLQLDRALWALGLHQLTDQELRNACYLRGLNATCLNTNDCREWLHHWLQLTVTLKDSEASLLLHSMVLLSVNYPEGLHR
ncbi:LETM1 domain-containing protein 1 [Polypterus senegalus]|uniref:LETM1 domain-containing protein 1 n=1 Tax=Polypterus senegalus TaxID=55291 RepID=UPI0019657603|nr:LETM1 domain-containing protein 1 [Polypterus senegalus]